jgi:hypothetical protein
VGFIARLHTSRLPGSGARKPPSPTNNLLVWVLPPLVICAVEAHPISPLTGSLSESGCAETRPRRSAGRLALRDCAPETHLGNRVVDAIWAVGAISSQGTDHSTAHTINCLFSVLRKQPKLFAYFDDEQFVLTTLPIY